MKLVKLLSAGLSTILLVPLLATGASAGEPGDIVARLGSGVDPAAIAAASDTTVVEPVLASRNVWRFRSDHDAHKAADKIKKQEGVAYAEEDITGSIPEAGGRMSGWNDGEARAVPSTEDDFRTQPAVGLLDLAAAHEQTHGAGVRVAVLDTGVDPSAVPFVTLDGGWDLVDDDPDPNEVANGVDDDGDGTVDEAHGHGTHITAIVDLAAPDVTVMPFRVLDAEGMGSSFLAAEAIWMALEQGADVINISFGAGEKSKVLEQAVKDAEDQQVVIVAAAGNTGTDEKHYPAEFDEVIATAALATDGTVLAGFSSRGGWVDISAPGEHIIAPVPGGGWASWSGTSMAAPFISGQAALLLALAPDMEAEDVWKALEEDALKVEDGGEGLVQLVASIGWVHEHYLEG
ncbi:S8 family serine peptidase [Euzebya pacifica]|uniref:S8 family serine peptidase n=1 Tax=Euzebya pacifica TaxID=1608957 RepID=UPI000DF7B1F2|nr:S8 family serine peptidase [Euzebya pacifica]